MTAEERTSPAGIAGYSTQDLISLTLKALKRYLIPVLVITGLLCGILLYRTRSNYTPLYTSYASFSVSISNDYGTSTQYYNTAVAEQLGKTFPYILRSNMLSSIVANELGLPYLPASVSAEALENTNIFTLTVTGKDPQQVYDILLSVIRNYPQIAEYVVGDTNLELLDESGIATSPLNQPAYGTAVGKGLLLGAALLCLLILWYILTRATVCSPSQIRSILNVKYLGGIPKIKPKKRTNQKNNKLLLSLPDTPQRFAEAIRLVRSRLEKSMPDGGILMVTSTLEGEGKTTLCVNLALSLARSGKKVILLDCDIRKPSVEDALQIIPSSRGLSDYLNGDNSALSLFSCESGGKEKLTVMAGGTPCRNAPELLSSERMRLLLKNLRGAADYVILDTAPSAILADAASLAPMADGILYTVRHDYADRDKILDGIGALAESHTPVVGCILNMTPASLAEGGYYYGYYGSYSKYHYQSKPENAE